MKAGFFHDSPIIYHDGKYYSRGFGFNIWTRYLTVFDKLVISTRILEESPQSHSLSSGPNIDFKPIDSYKKPISLLLNYRNIYQQIKSSLEEVDCAIIRLPSVIGWITAAIAKQMGKPVLIELVGCPWDAFRSYGFRGSLIAPFAFLITRLTVSKSDYTIYVTEEFLQKRYPSRGKTASISNVEISIDERKLQQRLQRIGRPQTELRLGSVGKIDLRYKGYHSAFKAVALLLGQGQKICYEIVGPGNPDELNDLARVLGIERAVHLTGAMSSQQLAKWMAELDIYIQPSLSEGLPRSVIEAMSNALPVILSEAGGHPELIDDRFRFPAGDSPSLAQRIQELAKEDLGSIAIQNFEKSREYERNRLQSKRDSILNAFKKNVLKLSEQHTNTLKETS